jgi:rod shape-determining protein MreD
MLRLMRSPWVRLVPVTLVALGVQQAVLADWTVGPAVVQLVLALAVAIGVGVGSEQGGIAGFVLGAMTDLAVGSPLGTHALAYGLAAMVAGYARAITPSPQWWLAATFAALGAAIGEVGVAVVRLFLGANPAIDVDLVRIVLIVAAAAAVLSPVLVPVGRWTMGARRRPWKAIPE